MKFIMLKSKLHNAKVTEANPNYIGSVTIDKFLMEKAGILPYEQVHLFNKRNGKRLVTYALEGSVGEICINGPAAKFIHKGDKILVLSFTLIDKKEAKKFKPKILILNKENKIA